MQVCGARIPAGCSVAVPSRNPTGTASPLPVPRAMQHSSPQSAAAAAAAALPVHSTGRVVHKVLSGCASSGSSPLKEPDALVTRVYPPQSPGAGSRVAAPLPFTCRPGQLLKTSLQAACSAQGGAFTPLQPSSLQAGVQQAAVRVQTKPAWSAAGGACTPRLSKPGGGQQALQYSTPPCPTPPCGHLSAGYPCPISTGWTAALAVAVPAEVMAVNVPIKALQRNAQHLLAEHAPTSQANNAGAAKAPLQPARMKVKLRSLSPRVCPPPPTPQHPPQQHLANSSRGSSSIRGMVPVAPANSMINGPAAGSTAPLLLEVISPTETTLQQQQQHHHQPPMQSMLEARDELPSRLYSSAAASNATLDGDLSVLAYSQRSLSSPLSSMYSGTLDPSWVEDELDVDLTCVFETDRVADGRCDDGNCGTHCLPQMGSAVCGAGKLPEPRAADASTDEVGTAAPAAWAVPWPDRFNMAGTGARGGASVVSSGR